MFVFRIMWGINKRGTLTKALFISIVTRTVCIGGGFRLKPSSMCWMRFVRMVEVEWFSLESILGRREGNMGLYAWKKDFFQKL